MLPGLGGMRIGRLYAAIRRVRGSWWVPYNYGIRFSAARARTAGVACSCGSKSRRPSDRHACQDIPPCSGPTTARAGCKPLRSRARCNLHPECQAHHTPAIPTAAWVPNNLLRFWNTAPDRGRPRSSRRVEPEVIFPIDLFNTSAAVKAGRVMVRMGGRISGTPDSRWPPPGAFRGAQRVRAQIPGVLARNGTGDVVGDAADDWAHWMAVSLISIAPGTRTRNGKPAGH